MRMRKHVAEPPKPFRTKKPKARKPIRVARAKTKPALHIGQIPKYGPKRPVNVSVSRDVLALAKRMKINLSDVLERELLRLTEEERHEQFRREHKAFIEWHNAHIERYGTLSEAIRDLDDPPV